MTWLDIIFTGAALVGIALLALARKLWPSTRLAG